MDLTYSETTLDSSFCLEAKELFETAFPPEERPPFELAISWKNSSFQGVFLENKYVALADVVVYEDLVYLFFLAVKKEYRGQGIGHQILSDLEKRFPSKRLFLLADECDPKYEDYEIRKKRMAFYASSGFKDSGLIIRELGVDYSLLYRNNPVSKQEFAKVMHHLIGDEMMKRYYPDFEF